MNQNGSTPLQQRKKFVNAFNNTMIKIWREKINLLGVIDTGALYRSFMDSQMISSPDYTDFTLSQSFKTYGLFVDWGVGKNTPRGNPGDLGHANNRRRRKWFSKKYFASVMALQEFYAENVGREFCNIFTHAFSQDFLRRQITL